MKKYELKDILLVRIIHYWRRKRAFAFQRERASLLA